MIAAFSCLRRLMRRADPLDGEVEAAPAASSEGDVGEWSGLEQSNDSASQLSTLPLPM